MNDNEKHAPRPKDPPPPPEKLRKRKKHRHVGLLIVLLLLLIIAILILMLVYGGFGGGSGSGSGGGAETSAGISDIQETSPPETETVGEQANAAILIEINGEKIIVDGEELENAAALKEKLLSINKEDSTYIIRDSRAVKSVYDETKAVLDELAYSYSEDA